ncbi:MAG: DVUA0089 family protein [Bryobacteraceae bacterium]|jgi:hypothetical protein
MNRLVKGILLLSLTVAPGFAATVLFQGTFSADDQVALFNITVNTPETVTIETDSYAGGTLDSTTVPAGGFAPAAFLFYDQATVPNVLDLTNGNCSQVGTDPTTGNCDDIYSPTLLLQPGAYILALAVYGNTPVDTSAADGFVEDGDPGFTCQSLGVGGSFCDLTTALGVSRTGNYAIAVTGADSVTAPEPGSMLLLLAGGALIALRRHTFSSR